MIKILLVDDLFFYIVNIQKKLLRYFDERKPGQVLIDIALEPGTVLQARNVLNYDIIITDNNMPDKDEGLVFISKLKELGYAKKIILWSGEEIPAEKYSRFCMDITFMEQPVDMQALYEFILNVLNRPYSFQ